MHAQTESHEDPGKVWGLEDQEEEERESCFWVATAPDVDEGAGEGGAEEGDGDEERGDREEGDACVEEEP